MSCVTQEVKDIYHLLEHEFLPLDLPLKVQPLLTKISKLGGKLSTASSVPEVQLSQYVPALEKLATLRLLQQVHVCAHLLYLVAFSSGCLLVQAKCFLLFFQVSNVYQTMKIETLSVMIPFFDFSVVEKISVDAVKHKFISMKVDHTRSVVIFCKMVCLPSVSFVALLNKFLAFYVIPGIHWFCDQLHFCREHHTL